MPLLRVFAPASTAFNFEEIAGNAVLRVEQHRILDTQSTITRGGIRGVRRELNRISPFRIRFRDFPKSVVAVANTEREIMEDWHKVLAVLDHSVDHGYENVKDLLSQLQANTIENTSVATQLQSPDLQFAAADPMPGMQEGQEASEPMSSVLDVSWSPSSAASRSQSAPVRLLELPPADPSPEPTPKLRAVRRESLGEDHLARFGAYICSWRSFFAACRETLKANDPVSISLIAFLFLLLYSMEYLFALWILFLLLGASYIVVNAKQHALQPDLCAHVADSWLVTTSERLDRIAARPLPLITAEFGARLYFCIILYTRPFMLLIYCWGLLLWWYLHPGPKEPAPPNSAADSPSTPFPSPLSPEQPLPAFASHSEASILQQRPTAALQAPTSHSPFQPPNSTPAFAPFGLVLPPSLMAQAPTSQASQRARSPSPLRAISPPPAAIEASAQDLAQIEPPMNPEVPPGYLGHLTVSQVAALEWLQTQLESGASDYAACFRVAADQRDRHALKWLRMQHWRQGQALLAAKQCLAWRKAFAGAGVNALTERMCSDELSKKKVLLTGRSRADTPVLWIDAHLHRKSGYASAEAERALVFLVEEALQRLDTSIEGPRGESITVVVNLSKFGIANVDRDTVKHFADLFSQNYPETLHSCYLVDAPWVFNVMWAGIKGELDPATVAKVHFVTQDQLVEWVPCDAWSPALQPSPSHREC